MASMSSPSRAKSPDQGDRELRRFDVGGTRRERRLAYLVAVAVRIDERVRVDGLRQRVEAWIVEHALDAGEQGVGAQPTCRRQRFLHRGDDQRYCAITKRQADCQFQYRAAEHGDLLALG